MELDIDKNLCAFGLIDNIPFVSDGRKIIQFHSKRCQEIWAKAHELEKELKDFYSLIDNEG